MISIQCVDMQAALARCICCAVRALSNAVAFHRYIYIPCAYFAGSPPTPIIDAPWLTDTQVAEYSKELAALAEESSG